VVWVAAFLNFAMLSSPANVVEGGWAYEYGLRWVPGLPAFVQWARLYILIPTIALHLTEAYIMTGKMEKHSVRLFGVVWWAWVGTCFIEGYGSFQR
jgi:hypothetical protein